MHALRHGRRARLRPAGAADRLPSIAPLSLSMFGMAILAGLVGLLNSFRMMRLPDPMPSGSVEGMALG